MTGAQRIFVMVCLPLLAYFLHVNLCEWDFSGNGGVQLLTWNKLAANGIWHVYGLFTEYGIERATALLCGVFLPLVLLAFDVFLLLGSRRQHRLAHNLCLACGYSLHGLGPDIKHCPECGKPVSGP